MVMLASDYDKSKYLRAEDLKGQEKKTRIKNVTEEVFEDKNGKPEKKPVLWFTRGDQGLVLNKTNNRTIRSQFGDVMDDWKDKIIILFPIMTEVRGQIKAAIRVRIPPPKQAAAPQQPVSVPSGNGPAAAPQQPAASGNGAAVAAPVAATALVVAATLADTDPELEPDPVKSLREEMDDEVTY